MKNKIERETYYVSIDTCPVCKGTGCVYDFEMGNVICSECNGHGSILR